MPKLSICHISSEVAPFAKTGGLADVGAGLCRYLGTRGHDVRPFLPLYRRIRRSGVELTPVAGLEAFRVLLGGTEYEVGILTTPLSPPAQAGKRGPVPLHLVDCPALYSRDGIYTSDPDEPIRFAVLCRAAIESCQRLGWAPDVFHLNDWHTGLLPLYLATDYAWDDLFSGARSLMTIHNIGYQGVFSAATLPRLGLGSERHLLDAADMSHGIVNFLKTGLTYADALATVSRTYAEEIQTPEFGMGLDDLLRRRSAVLAGIVNGVDYADWNPATDALIPANYTAGDLEGKATVKRDLLEDFDLVYDERVPLLGMVSRMTGQKGFDLLPEVLAALLAQRAFQLVVLGSGDPDIEAYFQRLRDDHPDRVALFRGYDNALAHRIEAAADMFIMPSRYEPCGLNQMYSLKYGAVPIVRRTGGLADTVEPFDPATGRGTGFVFDAFKPAALYDAMSRALTVFEEPETWATLVRNGMEQDFSWERQGPEYEALYRKMIGGR